MMGLKLMLCKDYARLGSRGWIDDGDGVPALQKLSSVTRPIDFGSDVHGPLVSESHDCFSD